MQQDPNATAPVPPDPSASPVVSAQVVHGQIVPKDEEEPDLLRDPRQRMVVRVLATGYTIAQAAKYGRVTEGTVRRWLRDPLFQWEVDREKAEQFTVLERAAPPLASQALAKMAEELKNPDPKVALHAAEGIRRFLATVINRGPHVAIQNNNVTNYNAPPPAITEGPPKIRGIREFVTEDLGRSEREFYPRVLWLLEQLERSDVREAVVLVGKGGGKSILAGLFFARMTQRLLIRDNPSKELGHQSDALVGLLNASITQGQAQMAVFRNYTQYVQQAPWFKRYAPETQVQTNEIRFPKNIKSVCGNSSPSGAEGINWLYGVADEVCQMPEIEAGGEREQRAADLITPVRATMNSRFPHDRKLMLMSWPTHLKDYMHVQIEQAVSAGIKEDLTSRFLQVPVTWGTSAEDATYRAKWDVEPFRQFKPSVFVTNDGTLVVKCPSWFLKPDCDEKVLLREWNLRPHDFVCHYAAAPNRENSNPYVRDPDAFERAANPARQHPVKPDGTFEDWFKGNDEFLYYGHIDVGVRRDAAGIAVGHYDNGRCVYDLMLEVKPPPGGEIRIKNLRRYIYDMEKRGFTFGKVTQDGFEGISGKQDMEDHGIESEIHSVDRNRASYDTWLEAYYDGNLDYYPYKPMFECVRDLIDLGRKIDHGAGPGQKKDVTDACAAVAWHAFEENGGYLKARRR